MKKRIWANPSKEWEGFRFAAYGLDWDKVETLAVTQRNVIDGKSSELSTTLGEVFKALQDQQFEIEKAVTGIKFKTANGELGFHRPSFAATLLAEIVKCGKEGTSAFDSVWFWYDSDSCRDEPHDNYAFFVVSRDRIVRESVFFGDYHGSGFDPDVFRAVDDSDSIWFNDEARQGAQTRYWYRKFYTETRTGQLMLLREDNPKIFDYQVRPGPDLAVLLQHVLAMLGSVRVLLWILIALGVCGVVILWMR